MKKITISATISILSLIIGTVLMIAENHTGEYLVASGSILGMYTCYLLDMEAQKHPENQL
jgi:hypothetical protein